jgi:soluble lytic murein transglycosylase-like protein
MERHRVLALVLAAVGIAVTLATPASAQMRKRPAYAREISEAASRYRVPERLIRAVIQAESGFDRRAVSPKGARGLMQLMPETAAILGVRDAFNPRENITAGVRHLRGLLMRFRNDLPLAIAAYNAGEGAVATFGGIPPYPETVEYVARVLHLYGTPIERGALVAPRLLAAQSVSSARERAPENGIRRIVEPDGTVVYTNLPLRRVSTASFGR